MAHRITRAALAAVLAAATWIAVSGSALAQNYGVPGWVSPEPNYYAMPTGQDGLTAALYPSPRPTPPLVGQTYITDEALAPHQFLYVHHRFYKTYDGGHQATRTSVTWTHRPTVLPHPSLTGSVPALRTPAGPFCNF